jgi:hypothetical protein
MSEYRVIRLPATCGGHLIISRVDEHAPTGRDASCPTGNSLEELRACLNAMVDATRKDVIERND